MEASKKALCFRSLLFMGITFVISFSVTMAQAELINGLPSSDTKPIGGWGKWMHMHPSSHEPTIADLKRQCDNNYGLSDSDPLDYTHCLALIDWAEADKCESVLVPDDFRFDISNGLKNGKSHPFLYVEKHTKRLDQALWCDLGNGVNAFWFIGVKNQSCNNLAWSFTEVINQKPLVETVVKTEVRYAAPARVMEHTGVVGGTSPFILTAPPLNNCCNCSSVIPNGAVILNNGQSLKSTGHSNVDW